MLRKRHIAYPVVFFLLLITVGAGLLFLTSYFLPGMLESKIQAILKKDAGISEFMLKLRELDLDGADLGPLRLGSPRNPALFIRSIQVDYSPGGLFQNKINNIVASGVEIYGQYKNGKWGLRDFDLEALLRRLDTPKKEAQDDGDQSPLSLPKRIEIHNGTLFLILAETAYRFPFEMVVAAEEDTKPVYNAIARIYLRGQMVKMSARFDLKQKRLSTQILAEDLNFLRFADLFSPTEATRFAGLASLDAKAEFQLTPFKVKTISGRLKAARLSARYRNVEIRNLEDIPGQAEPLIIDFEGPEHQNWKIRMSGFKIAAPAAARIFNLTATVQPSAEGYKIAGDFGLSFASVSTPVEPAFPIRFTKPFDLTIAYSVQVAKDRSWQIALANREQNQTGPADAAIEYGPLHISTKYPSISLNVNGSANNITVAYKFQIPDVHTTAGGVNIFSPRFVLTGKATIPPGTAPGAKVTINLNLSGSAMTINSTSIRAGRLSAEITLERNPTGVQDIEGFIRFANTEMKDTRRRVGFLNAKGSIPFQLPLNHAIKKGTISVEQVDYQKLDLGSIQAHIRQTESGMSFGGELSVRQIPQLSAKFTGESSLWGKTGYETRAQVELFYPKTGPEIQLGKLLPAAEGFTFEGQLKEQSNWVVGKAGVRATTRSSISNGTLRHRQNQFAIEDIQMSLFIPDLLNLRSAPNQKIQFARASFGDMNIKNGEIDFQIESAQSILIEKSHFIWCDGIVDAPAIRVQSGVEDYDIILYCDRLNLARVLEQFGAASVEAEGELNGRIPVRYQNGRLSFKDGFLFTTPGETGKIRMKDTEILTAGIPPDTPQYVQMELARKALEDYDYSWARLNLTTEGEDLLLNMKLDGKPARSLPFVYRKDLGGFAKVEADVQGSTFQGIRLDVNFRLPLNKLMQYKDLIKMIRESKE